MGLIHLEDMEFYAYHGHYAEEKVVGNKFIVNISVRTNLDKAGDSDNLDDTVDYVKIYNLTQNEMRTPSDLLEHIAKRIINTIHLNFKEIEWCRIKIQKMNPPIGGKMKCVSIELENTFNER